MSFQNKSQFVNETRVTAVNEVSLVSQNTQLIEDTHFSETKVKTKTAKPSYVILGLNLG